MKIGIVTPAGKRLNIEVEPEMLGEEIPEQLIENELLAPTDSMKPYILAFKDKDHRELDMGATLADNGVEENDTLQIFQGASA